MAETLPRFFIEETSFHLEAPPSTAILEQRLQDFIALLEACRDKGEPIIRSNDLFEIELFPGLSLSDLLFQSRPEVGLDPLVRKTLQIALFRCVEWDSPSRPPPAPQVQINGTPCEAATVALVHALLEEAHGAACLCLGLRAERSGTLEVRGGGAARQLHFVTSRAMLPGFYRSLFELEDLAADAYMNNAAHAFPEIAFAPGLSAQFSRFRAHYRDVRPEVTRHLAALNDHFQEVYRQADHVPVMTSKLLNSGYHVDATRESDLTRHNAKAMRERDVSVAQVFVAGRKVPVTIGRPVRCEWHTKIKPTADRIHFHPGDAQVAGGRLFVGLFHERLSGRGSWITTPRGRGRGRGRSPVARSGSGHGQVGPGHGHGHGKNPVNAYAG